MSNDINYQQVFDKIEEIILEQCDLEELNIEKIEPDFILNSELGIDSVDFLNVVFDIENEFGISIPIQDWMSNANANSEEGHNLFKMSNFVEAVVELMTEETVEG